MTSYDIPVEGYAASTTDTAQIRMRVGIPRDFFYAGLDPEVREATEKAVRALADMGAEVREIAMEVSTDRTVILAEAYSYHAENIAKHPGLYLPETLAKFQLGAGIDLGTYMKARLRLDQHRRESMKIFNGLDVLATPTTPVAAPRNSEIPTKFEEIMSNDSLLWRNTRPFNLSGLPTLSVPAGSPKQVCRSDCSSAQHHGRNQHSFAWHTGMNKRRTGTCAAPTLRSRTRAPFRVCRVSVLD